MTNLIEITGANNNPQLVANSTVKTNEGLRRAESLINKDRKWVAAIRSTLVNKWSGKLSILDQDINSRYSPQTHSMALERDFMVNDSDLLNLFSNAYVASRREQEKHYISDYYLVEVPPNNKRSIYLRFDIERDGWLDFCIKQLDENRVPPTMQSQMRSDVNKSAYNDDGLRYLKLRFILVKENSQNSPTTFDDPKYFPPRYDTYEIEYFHGYNRGDAKFLNVVRGSYILKIKPESVNRKSFFVVNYASNSLITMKEFFPDKKQTSLIMRDSMASLIGVMALQYPEVDRKFEEIVWANTFENIGYGFVGVRANRSCPYKLLIEVDPTYNLI